ncbi:MAG TPA: HAMP domain-containing sensor histidine kinase [Pirellulales bacterium]|nr:HAMP domain-containing sensor histidine kinase [Pirellulales bacterium]
MLSKWPIRDKLLVGLALLLVIVGTLSWGGLQGLYAYRALVRNLHGRVETELPLLNEFSKGVGDLRGALSASNIESGARGIAARAVGEDFKVRLAKLADIFGSYRHQFGNEGPQKATSREIEQVLSRIQMAQSTGEWIVDGRARDRLNEDLRDLQQLSGKLLLDFQDAFGLVTDDARDEYRALIILTWVTSVSAAVMLALFVKLFYQWIFLPLRVLIQGSRKVASGEFTHRIHLDAHDEMSELAGAMNEMTSRFQAIRDDLDRQVQERTKQVVRSEQLASVGFLAAGVAHEINNPLASIALCAESLEGRMADVVPTDDEQFTIVKNYLRMIQDEAFRCKDITERLLDFARIGEVKRQTTDLRELVQGVIEMVGHLGKYQEKHLDLAPGGPIWASVNAQEIKQVVLNLLTNGLDSLDPGGNVRVELREVDDQAEILVTDNGCGMTPDVLEQIFEPFFTRRRNGQGTGLGLSIVYRIIADHEGAIEVHSDGPGRGSTFRVRFPLAHSQKEIEDRYQAA